jgi:hypothetical protein
MSAATSEQSFSMAVEAIYATALSPSSWPIALQSIADCFNDVGTVLLYHRDDGALGTIVTPSLKAAQDDFEREWWRHDIRTVRALQAGYLDARDAATDRDVVTAEEIETHPFYTEFLQSHGLGWCACFGISPDPRVKVWISLQRNANARPPYSDAELDVLAALGRHAENALRLSIKLLDAELTELGLREALGRVDLGVFALDAGGRVLFSNEAGQRLLGDGIDITNERLRIESPSEGPKVDETIARTLQADPKTLPDEPRTILIARRGSSRPLPLYIIPVIAPPPSPARFLATVRAIVLVTEPRADDPADPAVLRELLGLTLGEARVAAWVGTGLRPREAAERPRNIRGNSTYCALARVCQGRCLAPKRTRGIVDQAGGALKRLRSPQHSRFAPPKWV